MKSYEIVAYTYDGVIYCIGCAEILGLNLKDDPIVSPVFADSEWESYPVCENCLETIEEVSLI